MRFNLLVAAAAALLALPLSAQVSNAAPVTDISAQSVTVGPGGVRVGDGHRRWESRRERRMDRRRCVTERTTRTTPSGRVIREKRTVCR